MSRYNEEEWAKLKEAERSRQKRKYQNKFLEDIYQRYSIEKEESERTEITHKHVVDIKTPELNRENSFAFVVTACVILVIGAWFLIAGVSENFFYEKQKKDLIAGTKAITKALDQDLNEIKKAVYTGNTFAEQKSSFLNANNKQPAKKWKRTFWEVKKGYGCINNKCTYQVMQYWKDCKITTGKCNTQSRKIKRTSDYLKNTKVTYL